MLKTGQKCSGLNALPHKALPGTGNPVRYHLLHSRHHRNGRASIHIPMAEGQQPLALMFNGQRNRLGKVLVGPLKQIPLRY